MERKKEKQSNGGKGLNIYFCCRRKDEKKKKKSERKKRIDMKMK